jgi:hypothetical protein
MTALVKGMLAGLLGTIILSHILHGQTGRTGELLAVHYYRLSDFAFYWSWPLFIGFAGLGWALFKMMGK